MDKVDQHLLKQAAEQAERNRILTPEEREAAARELEPKGKRFLGALDGTGMSEQQFKELLQEANKRTPAGPLPPPLPK